MAPRWMSSTLYRGVRVVSAAPRGAAETLVDYLTTVILLTAVPAGVKARRK